MGYSDKNSNIYLDSSPRVMGTKAETNKWDLIKFKSFCRAKETIKRQPTEEEEIFANDAANKVLISKINSLYNSVSKKQIA